MTERDYIRFIAQQNPPVKDPRVIHGIGDDSAVLTYPNRDDVYQLFTIDTITEGDHFRLDWCTPEQVGMRALTDNLSDIAAMGGVPQYALVSIALPAKNAKEFIEGFYRGFNKMAGEFGVSLIGGDLVELEVMVVSVTLLGEVPKDRLCLRSTAKAGDLVCVTGFLGTAVAGYGLLQKYGVGAKGKNEFKSIIDYYLNPRARVKEAQILAPYVSAMCDLSDGLGTDLREICAASHCGAVIESEPLPMLSEVREVAHQLVPNPEHLALTGGEDYELLFTMEPNRFKDFQREQTDLKITAIGKIIDAESGVYVMKGGQKQSMPHGFEHFA